MRSSLLIKYILVLLFPILILGQTSKNNLVNLSYDELWLMFFKEYKTNSNQIKYAETYLNKAKIENSNLEIGRGFYLYAFNSIGKDDNKAISYLEKSLKYALKSKDFNMVTTIYFDIAGVKRHQLKYKEAIDNFILAEKYNSDPDYTYIIKLNIAVIKSENLGEIDEALFLYRKCYSYYKNKDTRIPKYNGFYQEILFDLADAFKSKKLTDSATFYNKLGYVEAEYSKNDEMLNLFVLNEGANHVIRKNYKIALDSVNKALPVMKKYNNTGNILASYYYLGKIHEGIGNKEKAVLYYKKVDSIYNKSKKISPEFVGGYKYLISYYNNKGDNYNQLKFLNTFIKIDSTLQINYKDIYKTIQEEYEIPNLLKDKEELISNLKGNKVYYNFGIVVLLVFLLLISMFSYYQHNLKKQYRLRFEKVMVNNAEKTNLLVSEIHNGEENSIKNIGISDEIILQILEKLHQFELNSGYLESNITIQILSNQFNTNTKYLSRIINEYKKKSFVNYINELRVGYAIKQLKTNKILRKYTLFALTKEFGFNSTESFSSAFYKKTSIKPMYFIKELEKNNS